MCMGNLLYVCDVDITKFLVMPAWTVLSHQKPRLSICRLRVETIQLDLVLNMAMSNYTYNR
jgi:hypothetical protein